MTGGLRLLHSSDLHGHVEALFGVAAPFDVWVDTGDFFPNHGRPAPDLRIDPALERRHQAGWLAFTDLPRRLARWLGGRPAVLVAGNHDFLGLGDALRSAGAAAVDVTPLGVRVAGLTWAGFREVPWLGGEWAGERRAHGDLVELAFAALPDVLVTHAPPAGVLDAGHPGVPELAAAFGEDAVRPALHLFGHAHADGGREVTRRGTRHVNGANGLRLLRGPLRSTR